MIKIYIKSLKNTPKIRKTRLKSLALTVLELENAPKHIEIAITLVDDPYIQKLNKKYRKVDSPTDVLAFPIDVGAGFKIDVGARSPRPELLGDIYISLDRAQEQIHHGETLELEVSRLLIHGILHLLGYEHSQQMFAKQEYYLHKIKNAK